MLHPPPEPDRGAACLGTSRVDQAGTTQGYVGTDPWLYTVVSCKYMLLAISWDREQKVGYLDQLVAKWFLCNHHHYQPLPVLCRTNAFLKSLQHSLFGVNVLHFVLTDAPVSSLCLILSALTYSLLDMCQDTSPSESGRPLEPLLIFFKLYYAGLFFICLLLFFSLEMSSLL